MSEDTSTKQESQRPARDKIVVVDDSAIAHLMDTGRFEHMFRIAGAMASASLLPDHLWGRKRGQNIEPFTPEQVRANCFLIVNQSLRWGMDPFAVMPETYVVGGKLAYQGKLIAAVVNSRANLESRLSYSFTGSKGTDGFAVTVSGTFRGESKACEITLSVGEAKTENSMWKKDPEQKLIYSGVVKWARRYCPEVVLGVMTDDDAERIEMRTATGREVDGVAEPRVSRAQKPAPQSLGDILDERLKDDPTEESAATAEQADEFIPVQVIEGLQDVVREAEITMATFEAKCRKAKLLTATETISIALKPEKLAKIAAVAAAVIEGTYKEGDAQ